MSSDGADTGRAWYTDIADSLAIARKLGTLQEEITYLCEGLHSDLAVTLSKVRSEITIVAQIVIGLIIATVVISLYLPIFKLGSVV